MSSDLKAALEIELYIHESLCVLGVERGSDYMQGIMYHEWYFETSHIAHTEIF